jgi:phage gp29-like protein
MPATILDHYGRPIERSGKPVAGQAVVPSKAAWYDTLATDISPANIIQYLNAADRGLIDKQMQLFDRMVDRDDRLQAVLETRKLAVTGVDRNILPRIPDDPKAEKAAELVRDMVGEQMDDPLGALLDGVPKGLAVVEIVWDGSEVATLKEVPQRLLRWDGPDQLLIDYSGGGGSSDYRPLEPNKFVLYCPRNKPGSKERRGLLRALSMLWVAKHWGMRDWAAFVEVFGMPMRVGVYPEKVGSDQLAVLYAALQDLGTDSAAMIPENLRIEFPRPQNVGASSSETPMEQLVGYADRCYAIRVLGQNLTTEGVSGSGTLAGGAHENVRADYRKADAKTIASAIETDLFAPIVGFNLGWDYPTPRLWFDVEDPQDDAARATVYTELAKIPGMKFSRSQINEEFALKEPLDEEDTLTIISGDDERDLEVEPLAARRLGRALGVKTSAPAGQAHATDTASEGIQASESAAMDGAGQAVEEATRNVIEYVLRLMDQSETPEQLLRRIRLSAPSLYEDMEAAGLSMEELEDLVSRSMMTGEYNGEAAVINETQGELDEENTVVEE